MRNCGFTLIEIIIVIAMISGFYFLVTPLYTTIYKKNQMDTLIYEIKNAIYTAKLTSINTDRLIYLKPLNNDWSKGAKLLTLIDEENVIRLWQWDNFKIKINWYGLHPFLIFQNENNKNTLNGYFLLESTDKKYKLIINRLGRVRELVL